MNSLVSDLVESFAGQLKCNAAPLATLCRAYGYSRGKGIRIRDKMRELENESVPFSASCLRKGGRPRSIPADKRLALAKRLEERDKELRENWKARLPGGNARPKTARPYLAIFEVRRFAKELGVICSDPILRRLLARNGIRTAGQSLLQTRKKILKRKGT